MKKAITLISSLLIITLSAGSAFAWGGGKGRGYDCYDCPGYYGKKAAVDLSSEQKEQLTALRQKFIDDTYEIRSEKNLKAREIKLLMRTSDPDRAKLKTLTNEMMELNKQLAHKKIDHRLEMKTIAPELSGFGGYGYGKGRYGKGRCSKFGGGPY